MKVIVENEVGREVNIWEDVPPTEYSPTQYEHFEANVISYPATGIPNGTHECELVWQISQPGKPLTWVDAHPDDYANHLHYEDFKTVHEAMGYDVKRVYSLSLLKEQGERSGVKTAEEVFKETVKNAQHDSSYDMTIEAMHIYATQIAEAVRNEMVYQAGEGATTSQLNSIDILQYIK